MTLRTVGGTALPELPSLQPAGSSAPASLGERAFLASALSVLSRRRGWLGAAAVAATALSMGYVSLQTQQRKWIFQSAHSRPSTRDARLETAHDHGMESVWIEHGSASSGRRIRLHALWAPNDDPAVPVLLFLHGARRDVVNSAFRIERMREMGFSVLAVDYRGFGDSTDELPSEAGVVEDASAAWRWLGALQPNRPRYLYGHSLGGAIAVQLAALLATGPASEQPKGVILESTFTSIGDMFGTFKWGWLPISLLISQRFDSLAAVPRVKAPLLIVHGSNDALVPARFGEALFEKATAAKRFLLVDGASHSDTSFRGARQYRAALHELFGIGTPIDAGMGTGAGQ
ncbi:MAG: lysophospholipase [Pseudomonadota bacterium]|nr:lysophospholipase [Pseudomonadota bacterium]